MTAPDPTTDDVTALANRAARRAAKRHKHRWAEKPGYGVVCDVCGATKETRPHPPTAEDVIAEALPHHDACTNWTTDDDFFCWCKSARRAAAAAVVAAIRGMTVEQQAQLIGGTVVHASLPERGQVPGRNSQTLSWAAKRVVGEWVSDDGPWRAEP